MKFTLCDKNGNGRELTMEAQIEEAIQAKIADPGEDVAYMTIGGIICLDF